MSQRIVGPARARPDYADRGPGWMRKARNRPQRRQPDARARRRRRGAGLRWTASAAQADWTRADAIRGAAARRSAARARVAGELPPCCCCSSIRRSTRSAAAPSPATSPFGADFWRARGIDVVARRRGGKLDLPRPAASSSATRSCAHATSPPSCARWRARSSPRSPRRGSRRRGRDHEGPQFTGVLGRGPQDRVDRRPRLARRHHARFAVNVDNDVEPFHQVDRVRPARRADDLDRARDGRTAAAVLPQAAGYAFAQAHGMRQRIAGARSPLGPAPVPSVT